MLAAVQANWDAACGAGVAERATPVRERDGVVFVACSSAIWAQELDLIQEEIRSRLNLLLGSERVRALRFSADGPRHGVHFRA
jgi:predicted nucleic acid-binding Zn ribbon protein